MEDIVICGIYKITSPSGRIYIGESINIYNRWSTYKSLNIATKSQRKLWRSLNKHGVENHLFEVIEECLIENLLCRERYWQDFYDVLNGGLNLRLTECGELKQIPSEETKKKISNSQKGELNHMYGKAQSDEAKKKISIAHKGKLKSEETKLKMSNYRKLNHHGFMFEKGNSVAHSNKVINIETLEIYDSISLAAKSIDMKRTTLSKQLNGINSNKTNFLLLEEYIKNNEKR